MKSRLLVTGSIALDRIAVFNGRFAEHILPEKVHRLNVCFSVDDMTINHGGTGANIAYSLALMGEKPLLMGAVGEDAKDYVVALGKKKIDCTHVLEIPKKLTAHATIMTDMEDNQITGFYTGAMADAKKLHVTNAKTSDTRLEFAIIAPNDVSAMCQYADECFEVGVPFIADPGQAIPAFSKEDLTEFITGAHVLICNDYEWDMIQEKTGMTLKEVTDKALYLIVTYGENGSKIWMSGTATVIDIPAIKPEKIVDPTGCGDAYRAGLMYGMMHNYSIEQSAHIGAWMASKAIEKKGTQNHKIDKKEFEKFLKKI